MITVPSEDNMDATQDSLLFKLTLRIETNILESGAFPHRNQMLRVCWIQCETPFVIVAHNPSIMTDIQTAVEKQNTDFG